MPITLNEHYCMNLFSNPILSPRGARPRSPGNKKKAPANACVSTTYKRLGCTGNTRFPLFVGFGRKTIRIELRGFPFPLAGISKYYVWA